MSDATSPTWLCRREDGRRAVELGSAAECLVGAGNEKLSELEFGL